MARISRPAIAVSTRSRQAWRRFCYRWLAVDGAIAAAAAALLLSLAAEGQDLPEMVLGTQDGEYRLFTPDQVRAAETEATPARPTADGSYELGIAEGEASWNLIPPLSEQVYAALVAGGVPSAGSLLDVATIDPTTRTASLGAVPLGAAGRVLRVNSSATLSAWQTPQSVVLDGLPTRTGNGGRVLALTSALALEWTEKGGGGGGAALSDAKPQPLADPAAPGAGTKASRDDHAHPTTGLATAPQLATALQSIGANTADIQVNEQAVEHLGIVTSDLHAGTAPTGWSNAPSASAGAVALLAAPPTLARARAVAAADWSVSQTSGVAGKEFVVRLPVATDAGEARLRIVGEEDGHALTFDQPVTGLSVLGDSTDGNFAFYGSPSATGSADTQLIVQLSGTAAHVGTSRFAGDPTKVERWAIVGDPTAIPVRQVPDPAHIADGHLLTVDDGAYAWAAPPSNGGGGAAGVTFRAIKDFTQLASGSAPSLTSFTGQFDAANDRTNWDAIRAGATLALIVRMTVSGTVRDRVAFFPVNAAGVPAASELELFGEFKPGVWGRANRASLSTEPWGYQLRIGARGATAASAVSFSSRCRYDPANGNCTVSPFPAGTTWTDVVTSWGLFMVEYPAGGGSATPLSDGTPKALGTAAPGVGTAASRGDHVHPSELPATSSANALWNLRVDSAGNGVEWSNTLDRELTALTTRVTAMDNPRGPSAPKVGQSWQVVACTGSGDSETCQSGFRDQQDPPGFADGWVKLFEGQKSNVSGSAQIDFDLTSAADVALGFLEAQRDLAGMGVYRQFLFQLAWNIGSGDAEELVQAQAVLPGVPLGGSVAQARQGVRYVGALSGLTETCPLVLKASTTVVVVEGNGTCSPGWGNRGNQNVNLFWKLWGKR